MSPLENYELQITKQLLPPATCHIFIHLLVRRRHVVSPVILALAKRFYAETHPDWQVNFIR